MTISHKRPALGLFCGLLILAAVAPSVAGDAFTDGIEVHALPGQAAVVWEESGGGVRRVLASGTPITEGNRGNAVVLIEGLAEGSANDWYEDPAVGHRPQGGGRGWNIGREVMRDGGLFVHTPDRESPEALYYAVVADGEAIEPGRNATTAPFSPPPGSAAPIPQSDSVREELAGAPQGLPVVLYLHPHTSRPAGELTHLFFGDATMGWRSGLPFKFKVTVESDHILVEPFDRVWIGRLLGAGETGDSHARKFPHIESWWFGTNSRIDSAAERAKGVAENYTERWVLHILEWVVASYGADPQRVYATGTSMGSGALRLAFAHPDRFAAVDVLVPFVDMTHRVEGEDNAKRLRAALGGPETPLPGGGSLADRVNLVEFVRHAKGDLPFAILRVGRNDTSVFWRRKPDFFRVMEKARQGLLVTWDGGDHVTAGRKIQPGFPDFRDAAWLGARFALDRSFPALTNCSLDDDPGNGSPDSGDPTGFINRGIDWQVVTDESDRYELRLFGTLADMEFPFHVDITPRRLQAFLPAPGSRVEAVNADADGKEISREELVVDAGGAVTVPAFQVTSRDGNTLTLRRPD